MDQNYEKIFKTAREAKEFSVELSKYIFKKLNLSFISIDKSKSLFAAALYKKRGKLSRRLIHSGMATLTAFGMMIAPVVADEFPGQSIDPWSVPTTTSVLSATSENVYAETQISDKDRDKIVEYEVKEGDTLASIAEKFGVSPDTIRWENDLTGDRIKVGQILNVLPVTGVSHKVVKGDTVYSIAKKYDAEPQAIVNFPFNTFTNDETFALAIGQTVIVPDGIEPKAVQTTPRTRFITPDAGTVVASGAFVWPASGNISQNFVWYHKGIDIANKQAPNILAADAGKVIVAGWPDGYGYGNRVMIDHGNGYVTLYAHLSTIYVQTGQTVSRGAAIGKMGSTGRSTGIHLHFEVIKSGSHLSPLSVLK